MRKNPVRLLPAFLAFLAIVIIIVAAVKSKEIFSIDLNLMEKYILRPLPNLAFCFYPVLSDAHVSHPFPQPIAAAFILSPCTHFRNKNV